MRNFHTYLFTNIFLVLFASQQLHISKKKKEEKKKKKTTADMIYGNPIFGVSIVHVYYLNPPHIIIAVVYIIISLYVLPIFTFFLSLVLWLPL